MLIKPLKKKSAYLRDRLPIFALEEDKVIFKDGRVGIGFRVSGAPLESWTESQYTQANNVLSQQLKMLPVDTIVQKTDVYFDKEYKAENEQNSAYYEAKLHEHFFARLTLLHESYLFLSFPAEPKVNGITPPHTGSTQ